MSGPAICIIVAVAENHVIGSGNKLPWHLSADLKYFRARTMDKPVIMGRKTFQSIGRPLPGRDNIVISRDPAWTAEGIIPANDVQTAVTAATQAAAARQANEIMVIGGAEVYNLFLPVTTRLYVTEVALSPAGDALFPAVDPAHWQEISRESHPASGDSPAFSFVVYDRLS